MQRCEAGFAVPPCWAPPSVWSSSVALATFGPLRAWRLSTAALRLFSKFFNIDGRAADFHPGGEMELQYSEEKVRRQHQAQRDWDAQAVQQNWRRYVPSGAPRSQNTTPWEQRPHGSRRMPLVWTPSALARSVQLPVRDPYPGITALFSVRRVIEH